MAMHMMPTINIAPLDRAYDRPVQAAWLFFAA
jgi:hypothetical protein